MALKETIDMKVPQRRESRKPPTPREERGPRLGDKVAEKPGRFAGRWLGPVQAKTRREVVVGGQYGGGATRRRPGQPGVGFTERRVPRDRVTLVKRRGEPRSSRPAPARRHY